MEITHLIIVQQMLKVDIQSVELALFHDSELIYIVMPGLAGISTYSSGREF